MKKSVPVSSIMTKNVVKLNLSDDLTKAEILFKKHHIRHIPVVNGNVIIGMLSYTDLLRISFADAIEDEDDVDTTVYNMFTVEQVMAKKLVSISPETTIKGGGGNDTITDDKCPTGYTRNAKTGECEFDVVGLPSLFTNL